MRGSAQRIPGRPVLAALRAAWQGLSSPVHPGQEETVPLVGLPAQDRYAPCNQVHKVHPFGNPAQGPLHLGKPAAAFGKRPGFREGFPHE